MSVAASGRTLSTAVARWSGLGPYYAMFPVSFAFRIVEEFSEPGDRILDPFAGRASSIYAAAALGRSGYGVEINPVGWLYGRVKLGPATQARVLRRLAEISRRAGELDDGRLAAMPAFFRACYAPAVLRYLVAARDALRWRRSAVDATLMAIILVYLHGKRSASLSNQMRQGKAMAPDYSIRWWHKRQLRPPDLDPLEFLKPRIRWRFARGKPVLQPSTLALGDSMQVLGRVARSIERGEQERFDLLFTSPPYYAVTNYRLDQWLRLWMLGGPERPMRTGGPWEAKFESRPAYTRLLSRIFTLCAGLMKPAATLYVRTDARPFTYATTLAALRSAFPGKSLEVVRRPLEGKSQTPLFGDTDPKPGEIDLILRG